MTKDQILDALRHVQDPDLHKDLVTLGMIEEIQIEGNHVKFRLVLTTPACPLKDQMKQACIEAIHERVDKDAVVEVELTSKVTSVRKETEALLKESRPRYASAA